MIRKLLTTHEVAVTVEEASIGGLGAHVLTLASDEGLIDAGLKIRTMRLPDRFQEHDKPEKQYDEAGLNAPHIVETVLKALRLNSVGVEERAGLERDRREDAFGRMPWAMLIRDWRRSCGLPAFADLGLFAVVWAVSWRPFLAGGVSGRSAQ